MAEKLKYTATMNSKGLDTTGVTEDHARHMAATQGSTTMLIVEVKHGPKTIDEDGNTRVNLIPGSVEPVPADQEDAVREFQRALYRQRPEVQGQEALKGTAPGPSVADAATALTSAVEKDADGNVVGIWDGNPDAPADTVTCAFPGCFLPDDHDGEHENTEDDA